MRKITFNILAVLITLSSCQRGIDITQIEAMPNGAAKDSAMLYYYTGLKAGDSVRVEYDHDDLERNKILDKNNPLYLYKTADYGDKNQAYQINRGDTLIILGAHKHSVVENKKFMQKDAQRDYVKVGVLKYGKQGKFGWISAGGIEPMQHSWTMIFYDSVGVVGLMLILSLPLLVLFLVWKFLYWLIQDKIRNKECFYSQKKVYFKPIYFLISTLVGLFVFIVDFDGTLVNSLKFNPNFVANFSEYPLLLKLFPLLVLLWIGSMIGMLWGMIKKYKTWWLLIYFPGIWSIGIVMLALIFAASWFIYFILPTVVGFVIAMFASKADDATGGIISNGNGNKNSHGGFVGYNVRGETIGDLDRKDYPNVTKIP